MLAAALLSASGSTSFARQPGTPLPEPVAPYSPEAAVQAVDRFVAAFNAGDSTALSASFTTSAVAFTFDRDNRFRAVDWLPSPWSYHQLQARQLESRAGAWSVIRGARGSISVLQRLVSSSFVAQRERIGILDPDGRYHTLDWMVNYQVSDGRIFHLWIFPVEELDVPAVAAPRHRLGRGPVIGFDVGHGNLEAPEGSYYRFADLLRRDGYTVRSWRERFARGALEGIDVLVIVNAMPAERSDSGEPPAPRSAFSREEERALEQWVASGGSLLLVADHQPMAGASATLAARFGAEFHNGMARDTARAGGGGDLFRRSDGSLRAHAITDASPSQPGIDSVVTYLGQAFRGAADLEPLLVMRRSIVLEEPATDERPLRRTPVDGWLQGAVRDFGEGRVALFGEAWMFRFFERGQNAEFVLNLLDWLAGARGGTSD